MTKQWYEVIVWDTYGNPHKVKGNYPILDPSGQSTHHKIKEEIDFNKAVESAYLFRVWSNSDNNISIVSMPECVEVWKNGNQLVEVENG